MKLKRNMSTVDRIFRAILGTALIYFGPVSGTITSDFMSGILLGAIGLLAIGSAATAHCPMYHMAGFCTYKPPE